MSGKNIIKKNAVVIIKTALLCIAGMFLLSDINVSAAGKSSPVQVNGRLSVKKGSIVNKKGKKFVIKGVSTHGLAWFPEYVNREAFKTMRDKWGVNTVRLAMYTEEYGGYCSGGNTAELEKIIDDGVSYATELGMYVIIDWHILSDGNPLTHKDDAVRFFKKTAVKYADNKNVIYEICNEPNGQEGNWNNIKKYASDVIAAIRQGDGKAVIIVGTPTWSQDVDEAVKNPVKGYGNIAYAFHFYAGTHREELRNKLKDAVDGGLAVIVSEFGISEASGGGKADTKEGGIWMDMLDRYGIGRVCWSLSNKDETCSLVRASCGKKSGWKKKELTVSGKWLVKRYRK